MVLRLATKLAALLTVTALVSCGGESGGSGEGGLVGGTDGNTGATGSGSVSLALLDQDGGAITAVNGYEVGYLTAEVKDSSGDALESVVVTFAATIGAVAELTALTNDSGIAVIEVRSGSIAGAGEATASATVGGESLTSDVLGFESDGLGVARLLLYLGTPDLANIPGALVADSPVSNSNLVSISALVQNDRGELIDGALVSFILTGEGRLSKTENITQAGIASSTVMAGTSPGYGSISASTSIAGIVQASSADNTIAFETLGDEPFAGEGSSNLSIGLTLVTNNPLSAVELDAEYTGGLEALVTQSDGTPAVNMIVQFALDGNVGTLYPPNGLALTNSDGIASVVMTAGSVSGAGTATASIVIDGQAFNADSTVYASLGNEEGETPATVNVSFNGIPADEDLARVLTAANPATISIQVTDSDGNLLPNRKIFISTNLGLLRPSTSSDSGQSSYEAVTADGKAQYELLAPESLASKNGTLAIIVGSTSVFVQFELGIDGLQLGICTGGTGPTDCGDGTTFEEGQLDFVANPLSALGSTVVSLLVVDAEYVPVSGIEVGFSTGCADNDLAQITATGTSNALGIVTSSYVANGCEGLDTVTATEISTEVVASGEVEILSAMIGSIRFVSVTPGDIQIRGSGDSTAIVVFQVLDVQGLAVVDALVSFELTSAVGGVSLVGSDDLSDAEGNVTALVQAGLIATTVRVRASVDVDLDGDGETEDDATSLETLSDGLSINTGVPDQNSMSLVATDLNIEGDSYDGTTTQVTVRLADAFNNPVPDDTTIQFRTEFGAIESSCNTSAGACSVIFTSQEPRLPVNPNTTVQEIGISSCPALWITDESVTIDGTGAGMTDYVPLLIARVEKADGTRLQASSEGIARDFSATASGITCDSIECTGDLLISYARLYLDETGGADGSNDPDDPAILQPGVATAPFYSTSRPCMAGFRSKSPEASAYLGGLGQIYGVRGTILAFAQGEETFIDTNGNGLYDFGDPFVDLPEAFHDLNEDDVFANGDPAVDGSRNLENPFCYGPQSPVTDMDEVLDKCFQQGGEEETFIDFITDGYFNDGNGIYNGTLCPEEVSDRTDTCDNDVDVCDVDERYCSRDLVNVRRDLVVLMSGSFARFGLRDAFTSEWIDSVDITGDVVNGVAVGKFDAGVDVFTNDGTVIPFGDDFEIGGGDLQVSPGIGDSVGLRSGTGSVSIDISDSYNAGMASGTTVSVTGSSAGCEITGQDTFTFSNAYRPASISVGLGAREGVATGAGAIEIRVRTPIGNESLQSFPCQF
ncbi:MAG: hypothetical protein HOI43_09910 [Gammaproteobacteria bacterium]|nr:hypothetical protein [Gammaproteobacteria bacterium]